MSYVHIPRRETSKHPWKPWRFFVFHGGRMLLTLEVTGTKTASVIWTLPGGVSRMLPP